MAKKISAPDSTTPTQQGRSATEIDASNGTPHGPATEDIPATNPSTAGSKSGNVKKGKKNTKTKKAKSTGTAESKEQRSFPIVPLEEALKVGESIRRKSKGNPCETDLVAEGCGLSRKNQKFFYMTAASRDYGLTTGTRDTPTASAHK